MFGRILGIGFVLCIGAIAQDVERGRLPEHWATGGPNCLEKPGWEIHEYNASVYVLRESGCTHYEKPFLYLFFGKSRALLVDTGAGVSNSADIVTKLIADKQAAVDLVVSHSHGHGDHVAGDAGFAGKPRVTVITATVEAEKKAFGIANWPDEAGSIDLGDRVIDVLPIPGHEPAHLAYYDRRTGLLLTGDHLYPGRLYITDFPAYLESTRRLVRFTQDKTVTHILGNHIEQSLTPYLDYPVGTKYQPEEHSLELGRAHLLELLDGLERQTGEPRKVAYRDFTIVPRKPRAQ